MAGEVTFSASEADNIGAQRDWWRSVVFRRSTGIRYAAIAGVAFILFAGFGGWSLAWPNNYRPYLAWGVGGALYVMLVYGLCPGGGYLRLPRRAARLFRQAKMAGQQWTVSWDDEGLSYIAPNGTGRYHWVDFDHWREGRHATLCFVTDNSFIYIPHRVLNIGQREDITESLSRSELRRA